MLELMEKNAMLMVKVHLHPKSLTDFAEWQAKLNTQITSFPGFISLEILSRIEEEQPIWTLVLRFYNATYLSNWRASKQYQVLLADLRKLLASNSLTDIQENEVQFSNLQGGVTEVFVTQVSPDQEEAYRNWIAKIHQVEAQFPGFRGMYVQSPHQSQNQNWITFLQFDTPENLDRWLSSSERKAILQEAKTLIFSLENHRIISPYAGWFTSFAQGHEAPSVWKQTMLVLLVLFPIVMFELKFLSPLLVNLNSSLATFIGNALSVALISWPLMPFAIRFLGWWLVPRGSQRQQSTLYGTFVIIGLYLLEIILFWRLF